ncbi:hypothetical protein B0H10DRAFT_2209142 [Mycena sp. CBHHK59/15]|nr:hypothetical protein B0H10DRAFT_2209142 [Mycena sp. CBHHK59/15]
MGSHIAPTPRAPPEIWRFIFWFATSSATSYHVDYTPFQPPPEMEETSRYLEEEAVRLQTCLALIRVCRLWRTVAEEFLYEDVRIFNSRGLQSLFSGLHRSATLPLGRSLHTLRLNRNHFHTHHSREIRFREGVPAVTNLTNLVLHTTVPSTMLSFLSAIGRQLRVLEFTFAPQLTFSSNQMHRILSRCPNLEELVYHLGAPEISPLKAFQHTSLKRVRLKLNPDEWYPYKHIVLTQFDILAGPSFPSLEQVLLHDSSRSFIRRDSASPLLMRMVERGCPVMYEDGSDIPLRK